MKNTRLIFSLSLALLFVAVSCNDDDFVEYGNEFFQEVTDPYLQIVTPVVSFQAGTPSYDIRFNVVNGSKRINEVAVFSVFTYASGEQSNEVLLGTYPLSDGQVTNVVANLTYDDLKNGLVVDGEPLPENEVDVAIGSGWLLRFVGRTAEGSDVPLAGNIRIGVLSRFAGLYEVVESVYYRIGVQTAVWTGQTRFIGSVDATTFSYNDFWGNFAWGGNAFHFRLDESDNTITVPIIVDGLFSGDRALDCAVEPQSLPNVPCDGSNILIPDEVGGHHEIRLTYGYFTNADGGAREFYEVLRKL